MSLPLGCAELPEWAPWFLEEFPGGDIFIKFLYLLVAVAEDCHGCGRMAYVRGHSLGIELVKRKTI